jgi:hypothetical protein
VHRLRRASVEEIAKVPYFGLQMAVRLVEFLKARSEPSTTKTGESDS